MDVLLTKNQQRFLWNAEKAAANLLKHGVSFEEAIDVFFDPFFFLLDASSNGEVREAAIGTSLRGGVLYVVHAELVGDVTRIISAREATTTERRAYEDLD